jgi:hypothetical protein
MRDECIIERTSTGMIRHNRSGLKRERVGYICFCNRCYLREAAVRFLFLLACRRRKLSRTISPLPFATFEFDRGYAGSAEETSEAENVAGFLPTCARDLSHACITHGLRHNWQISPGGSVTGAYAHSRAHIRDRRDCHPELVITPHF